MNLTVHNHNEHPLQIHMPTISNFYLTRSDCFPRKPKSKEKIKGIQRRQSCVSHVHLSELFYEMERRFDGTYIKKGPWGAEEDEILINHVKKNGSRDWSSILSNGLLPRTGKSCRLRWVNKLRPNLKGGCKFSAEEERVVIELQAQLGNKWAKIAKHLPGRTDNDVKNYWSSRRKKLERMLQQRPSPPNTQKSKGKTTVAGQVPVEEAPACSSNQLVEDPSCFKYISYAASFMGNTEVFNMVKLPDLAKPSSDNLEKDLSVVEASPLHVLPPFVPSSEYTFVDQLLESQVNIPLLPECQDLAPEPFDPSFLGLEGNNQSTNPNGFFEDFPTDMFDYFQYSPSSSQQ